MINSSYKKKDISELIKLAQQDDYRAIEAIIRLTQKNIYAMLSYLVNDNSIVADLTQNVLIKMVKNIKSLKHIEKFSAWLNKIISNVYYDYMRKLKKNEECISIDNEECKEVIDENAMPVEKCATSELEKLIKDFILKLPSHFKIAIILREFAGLSYREIADVTNSEIGTVKSRISRARTILQNQLKNCI